MQLSIKGEFVVETDDGFRISTRFIELLIKIDQTGSLNMATKEMDMSYSYAWNTLFKINCQLGTPLLVTQRGGKGGGLAELTPAGKKLVTQYAQLKIDFKQFLENHAVKLD